MQAISVLTAETPARSMERRLRIEAAQPVVPQIWGGAEYTCNRVGNRYFDQMELSGHAGRIADYQQIATLGISTLRFGLLWERYARTKSWRWADERLHWMQQTRVRPIASLMHHGSGPPCTSLLDADFPQQLAAYAAEVAQRYPWIDAYTPVNEADTTARFSGMYGLWYPHHRSRKSYLSALLLQMKATVLSMKAVRRINPEAHLIQTEDAGMTYATPELAATADLLNERRWLPFDLLCGRITRGHAMFEYLQREGVAARDILWFSDNPCPPQTVGINYYSTSDRYLDHRIWNYPANRISSEGRFVDVEAVRVACCPAPSFYPAIMQAFRRYRLPVAVTEVHLGGATEEQIRWAHEAWRGAIAARQDGADCIAITFWALFGSFYWNTLVTSENGYYETGVFDVSSGASLATELAGVVTQMASGAEPRHPALRRPGWWRLPERICFGDPEFAAETAA